MSGLSQRAAPRFAVALVALAGSLAIHVPAYVGLGLLESLLEDEPVAAEASVELEIVEPQATAPVSEASTPAPGEDPEHDGVAIARERERELERDVPQEQERRARREPERAPLPTPRPVEPPPDPARRRTSVAHRSRDPSVAPPEDARYLAEENSRVEEETLARVRSAQADEPDPSPAAARERVESEDEGDSAEQASADLHDAQGSNERNPTPEEARLPPERPREHEASRSPTPQASQAARGDERAGSAPGASPPSHAAGGGRRTQGGAARSEREVIVSDGTGTFRVRVPNPRPEGEGEGEGGDVASIGPGRGHAGEGRAAGAAGRGRHHAQGGGAAGAGAPDLRMSWTQFASLYGEEELRRQREAYLEQRRSRTRGSSHQQRWERFRAALEHYDVSVRPGNQTALNTRADPFAAYIASMHRRIHRRFAEDFLVRPPPTVAAVLATNPDMHTKLEIAIDANGRVARIGVVATSGDILFDYGAYNSVMTAQPFEATPEAIRSPDGLVYLHWSFYANERRCGTMNAEAYILARAPEGPARDLPVPNAGSIFRPSPEERETPDRSARDEAPSGRGSASVRRGDDSQADRSSDEAPREAPRERRDGVTAARAAAERSDDGAVRDRENAAGARRDGDGPRAPAR
ncbi:MAG TPA: hypothetical protein VIL20_11035 [Sandaracinaceae bacterium]